MAEAIPPYTQQCSIKIQRSRKKSGVLQPFYECYSIHPRERFGRLRLSSIRFLRNLQNSAPRKLEDTYRSLSPMLESSLQLLFEAVLSDFYEPGHGNSLRNAEMADSRPTSNV